MRDLLVISEWVPADYNRKTDTYRGDEGWRFGNSHNIKTPFINGCWCASFLTELGCSPLSKKVEENRISPILDDGNPFMYADLREEYRRFLERSSPLDPEGNLYPPDFVEDLMRAQRTRLLLKLVSDYVQGREKCDIATVARYIAQELCKCHDCYGKGIDRCLGGECRACGGRGMNTRIRNGDHNDTPEALTEFMQWIRCTSLDLELLTEDNCSGCGRISVKFGDKSTCMEIVFPVIPDPSTTERDSGQTESPTGWFGGNWSVWSWSAASIPEPPVDEHQFIFQDFLRGYFTKADDDIEKQCRDCSRHVNRDHKRVYKYAKIQPGTFINMQVTRFEKNPFQPGIFIKRSEPILNIPQSFEMSFDRGENIVTFELKSFVVHQGTYGEGHYFSFGRTPRGWMKFDDTVDNAIGVGNINQELPNAYLMLWEVTDTRDATVDGADQFHYRALTM